MKIKGTLLSLGLAIATIAPAATAQTPLTPNGDTQALIDRLVSEQLAERDQRIAELERRLRALEGNSAVTPQPAPAPAPAPAPVTKEHVIAEGDTLVRIAQQHGITVEELANANQLSVNQVIFAGQKLRIPAPGKTAPAPQPSPAPANEGTYVVKPGDTLTSIARANKTTIEELKRLNGITNPNQITIGRSLKLNAGGGGATPVNSTPKPKPNPGADGAASGDEQYFYYEVAQGDTLASVAKHFYTTTEELVRLNKLPSNTVPLQAGKEVIVPTKRYFAAMRGENGAL